MKKRVLLFSIDSLFDSDIPFCLTLPNFGKLFKNGGRCVGGMRTIYPSFTYPVHASIITGTYPEVHGIFHNERLMINDPAPEWYWYYKDLKVETLIDCAKRAGYTTASIGWPVMAACPSADYCVPEIWARNETVDPKAIVVDNSSANIRDNIIERHFHKLRKTKQPFMDEFMIGCACDIIRQHKPDLMIIHGAHLDHTRHAFGLEGPMVERALIANDDWLGRLMEATMDIGEYENTDFIVIGDHGHLAVKQVFNPNVLLAQAGLIELGGDGKITEWAAYCNSTSLSCQVVMKDPSDMTVRRRLLDLMYSWVKTPEYGVENVFTKEELKKEWHLEGDFEYMLESRDYTSFGNATAGPVIVTPDNSDYKFSVATHGHLPTRGCQPAFIVAGPHFKENGWTERKRVIDEAPTIAKILGVDMPHAQGCSIDELLK